MSVKCPYLSTTSLLVFAAKFAAFLFSFVSVLDKTGTTDETNITVPVSCSIEGMGIHVHHDGTYQ